VNILIGAGGTGGHLFPAIAVAEEIKKQYPKSKFYFAGRSDKIEGRVVPEKGFEFIPMQVQGITKLLSLSTIKSLISLKQAQTQLKKYIADKDIDAVICTGAYLSIPPGMVALQEKLPLFLMESNVNPGRAIRQLSPKATNIYTSFPETKDYFSEDIQNKIVYTGNPVRKEFYDEIEMDVAKQGLGFPVNEKMILIFGGSLGAKAINSAIEENIDYLASKANILWQIGNNYEVTRELPNNVKVVKFIDDMATAYAASDFVISRSGATTVAELTITGKPAILIPLKTSANNEQTHNAINLNKQTGTLYVENANVSYKLIPAVDKYLKDISLLGNISEKLTKIAQKDAASIIANNIINHIIRGKNG
jgi:UDP-N-acetylglucosamine--N-acetylmuramyl-(pentapeptide) pyrophosphoryl-undecaprenol N-acetylglucosamine transferase